MAAASPFAQMPLGPEPIIARVRTELARDCEAGRCPPSGELDRLVESTVRQLWSGRVKVFVSVLAVREVREALAGDGPGAGRSAGVRTAARRAARPDDDELVIDGRDVLTLSDDGAG